MQYKALFGDINDIHLRAVNLTKRSAQENRNPNCFGCVYVGGSEHLLLIFRVSYESSSVSLRVCRLLPW